MLFCVKPLQFLEESRVISGLPVALMLYQSQYNCRGLTVMNLCVFFVVFVLTAIVSNKILFT